MDYNHNEIEAKWRKLWDEKGTNDLDLKQAKNPFYNLVMFPYPSAEGLHVGNVYCFTGSDIYGRYKRLQGFNVFEPMGFDAFGIHSENYAIKQKVHPKVLIPRNINNFRENQLKKIGAMYPWKNQVDTTSPEYYKWTQWIFLQLYKQGLAYRKTAPVNWCTSCKTVLANEQVEGGVCERCKSEVIQRKLDQWFFRTTDYAQRLLDNIPKLDWSDVTRTAQTNWIGRSEGAEIDFTLPKTNDKVTVFTTRPDTLFGATYMVLAPEHPLVDKITTAAQRTAIETYRTDAAKKNKLQRTELNKDKTGVFTGAHATNPVNGKEIPIWISDYVLMDYGTGAIMAVPAHDERDHEFAKKFNLPIIPVISCSEAWDAQERAHIADGKMINSGRFDGMDNAKAFQEIVAELAGKGIAKKTVKFRLNDWCISRQRYWGPPIPMIYCDKCGDQTVPEKDLPVTLPDTDNFYPDDSGKSPLARVPEFVQCKCPKCGGPARRDTDVSDNFLDSAWYFLRYPSARDNTQAFDPELTRKWLPVNMYVGGNEHACMHLMYTRFLCMALHDAGIIPFEEPFKRFRANGMIIKDGAKMSKSRGNIVTPDSFLEKYGSDTFRMYLMFLGPFTMGGDFNDKGIVGIRRFVDKVYSLQEMKLVDNETNDDITLVRHKTVKAVSNDLEELQYHTAIARLMEFMNAIRTKETIARSTMEDFLTLLAPLAPHICEEMWQWLGHKESIFNSAKWPTFDDSIIQKESIEFVVQLNSKVRAKLRVPRGLDEAAIRELAMKEEKVRDGMAGKTLKKTFFIADRLINFVVV